MTLPETLGANVTRLVNERALRDELFCHVWTTLAREGWPDDARAASRAVWLKRVAKGECWPARAANLEILARVLEVHPWELLRPCTPQGRYPDTEIEGGAL